MSEQSPYAVAELAEAERSIASTLSKCVKVLPKLRPGSAQHTLLQRRIKAFDLALALIRREAQGTEEASGPMKKAPD
ncbi:MAG: hypothetical protein RBU37_22450 [Myxococcota bacterium]|jgi:hypothetical protein|nr:hypothetical protein [Myxococcota bacterium]